MSDTYPEGTTGVLEHADGSRLVFTSNGLGALLTEVTCMNRELWLDRGFTVDESTVVLPEPEVELPTEPGAYYGRNQVLWERVDDGWWADGGFVPDSDVAQTAPLVRIDTEEYWTPIIAEKIASRLQEAAYHRSADFIREWFGKEAS